MRLVVMDMDELESAYQIFQGGDIFDLIYELYPEMGSTTYYSTTYYKGDGQKWGIWNNRRNEFQFGICEDSPMLAEARLYQKIGVDGRHEKFEIKPIAESQPPTLTKAQYSGADMRQNGGAV